MALVHVRVQDIPSGNPIDNEDFPALGGFHKELIVNELMGKYYHLTRRGRVFNGSSVVAGVAFPINTTTAPVFGFWNPLGSNVLMVPLIFSCSYVSGTNVQTGVGLNIIPNAGGQIAAANAPITAFTETATVNALYGMGKKGAVRMTAAATTIAGTWLQSLGFNTFTGAATVPINTMTPGYFDFQGALQIPPGNMIFTVGNAASVALYQQSLWYAEVPFSGN